jgi:hypothetical protein
MNRCSLRVLVALLGWLCVASAAVPAPQRVRVDPVAGIDSTCRASNNIPCKTIGRAMALIDEANSTITLLPGLFRPTKQVQFPWSWSGADGLTLRALVPGTAVISCAAVTDSACIWADNLALSIVGLVITGASASMTGVVQLQGPSTVLKNCSFVDLQSPRLFTVVQIGRGRAVLQQCRFLRCVANSVVTALFPQQVLIAASLFSHNLGTVFGLSALAGASCVVSVRNTLVTDNLAVASGFGTFDCRDVVSSSVVRVQGCSQCGPAIFTSPQHSSSATLPTEVISFCNNSDHHCSHVCARVCSQVPLVAMKRRL